MICQNLITSGLIVDISDKAIMIDTEEGMVTLPVKDPFSFKYQQRLIINVQISSD